MVILKHVFTLEELAKEPDFVDDIKQDMEDASAEHGEVKNITVFDLEDDGIVTVRFSNNTAAKSFARKSDGRLYDGRTLEAYVGTGLEKFKKTRKGAKDKDAAEAKRLEEYSKYIESNSDTGAIGSGES